MSHREDISRVIAGLAEYYDKNLSVTQLAMYVEDLVALSPDQLLRAVREYRADPKNDRFPLPAKLLGLAAGRAQHPLPGEAWAMISHDERDTFVWTEEMQEAFGIARPLLLEGDSFGARKAFEEVYARLVGAARAAGKPAKWTPSLGLDRLQRSRALVEAKLKGYLTADEVTPLLIAYDGHRSAIKPAEMEPTLVHQNVQEILARIAPKQGGDHG